MGFKRQVYVSQDWGRDRVMQKHSKNGMWRETCSQEKQKGGKRDRHSKKGMVESGEAEG